MRNILNCSILLTITMGRSIVLEVLVRTRKNRTQSSCPVSQHQKYCIVLSLSLTLPGCPPVLDWDKMDAEEGEICLTRQAENAPELNTQDSIFKSVSICTPELEIPKVCYKMFFSFSLSLNSSSGQYCD